MRLKVTVFASLIASSLVVGDVTSRIGDVVRLKGHSINRVQGMGIVTGLKGTGDGDQYLPAMRPLVEALAKFANPVSSIEELGGTRNVAIVLLEAVIPEDGTREGGRIDVQVTSIGQAKSLEGGRLLITPLILQGVGAESPLAFASGAIETPNNDIPTMGVIKGGAVMEEDVMVNFLATGRDIPYSNPWIHPDDVYLTLVLDDPFASWALAVEISDAINAELSLGADVERVALAVDSKNVVVYIPPFQRSDPGTWIRDILDMSLLVPASEAKISIDRMAGTFAVVGHATISPVVVSHRGLTVTVTNPDLEDTGRGAGARAQDVIEQTFLNLGSDRGQGAKVDDLLDSLNQLRIPIEDRIAIIENIHRLGKLHAKLVYQD